MTKRKLLGVGACLMFLGVGLTACLLGWKGHEKSLAGEQATTSAALEVKVVHPKIGVLERVCVQPGSVQAFESIRLFAKVAGYLETQKVDIGDHVKNGEQLAIIFVPDIKADVERNVAAVERAQAKLQQTQARVAVARANLSAAQAAVVQAEAKLRADSAWVKFRTLELGRIQDLVVNRAVEKRVEDESRQYFDSAVESENTSRAAILTAKANVEAGVARLDEAQADRVEAQAEVKFSQAVLKRSQVDLDFATIRAPFDGVITHRGLNPGDFVKAADTSVEPLFTIDRTDLFRVVVLVPERDVRFMRQGQTAMVTMDALPGRQFPARVSRFAQSLDRRTRLMRVELDLPNPAGEIYNDMYGQVTIVLEKGSDLVSIPASCLAARTQNGKGDVFVVRSGRAEKVQIDLVMDSGVRVALTGLHPEDAVIVSPNNELIRQPALTPVPTNE